MLVSCSFIRLYRILYAMFKRLYILAPLQQQCRVRERERGAKGTDLRMSQWSEEERGNDEKLNRCSTCLFFSGNRRKKRPQYGEKKECSTHKKGLSFTNTQALARAHTHTFLTLALTQNTHTQPHMQISLIEDKCALEKSSILFYLCSFKRIASTLVNTTLIDYLLRM